MQDFEQKGYYAGKAHEHLREGVKGTLADTAAFTNRMSVEQLRSQVEHMAWGTPDDVVEAVISEADQAGADTVLLMCNRGAMPYEMFLNQVRRIGEEVLPRLQAHKVVRVPYAEGVTAEV